MMSGGVPRLKPPRRGVGGGKGVGTLAGKGKSAFSGDPQQKGSPRKAENPHTAESNLFNSTKASGIRRILSSFIDDSEGLPGHIARLTALLLEDPDWFHLDVTYLQDGGPKMRPSRAPRAPVAGLGHPVATPGPWNPRLPLIRLTTTPESVDPAGKRHLLVHPSLVALDKGCDANHDTRQPPRKAPSGRITALRPSYFGRSSSAIMLAFSTPCRDP